MGPHRQEPYARYRIRQYEEEARGSEEGLNRKWSTRGQVPTRGERESSGNRKSGADHDSHSPNYEDVRGARRQASVRKSGMQTTVTSFGEGLRRPSQLFGSLKKAGQRFVGAEHLQGSLTSVQRLTGRKSKCQCRHHQQKLLVQGDGKEEIKGGGVKTKTEEAGVESAKESRRESFKQNRAFIEAKKVFRGDGEAVGNDTHCLRTQLFLIEIVVNGTL